MRVVRDYQELAGRQTAVALGTFDGLHLGHQQILEVLKDQNPSLQKVVYTFSNVPTAYFSHQDMALFTEEEKIAAFQELGIDCLYLVPFDAKLAQISPAAFVHFLVEKLGARFIVAGFNYSFGRHAKGSAAYLKEHAEALGAQVFIQPPVNGADGPVSSTRIRGALLEGRPEEAEALLGRPYSLSGVVAHGKRLGRTIGFPTVNFYLPAGKLCPKRGVYAAYADYQGQRYTAITNIGIRPTVDDGDRLNLESHLMGFEEEIYGRPIRILLKHRLREETKFKSVELLKEQLERDKKKAVELLGDSQKDGR